MGDWPNDGRLSALQHPPRLRRVPAAAADRLHRPLPDAPRRPRHAVGRDLAGDGGPARTRARSSTSARPTSPAGTSRRPRRRPRRRGFLGLVSEQSHLQPADPRRRARGAAGRAGLRPRRHPVVAAARRPARRRRCARSATGSRRARRAAPKDGLEAHRAADRGVRGPLRRARRGAGRRRPRLAAAPARRSPRRSSARARSSSSTASLRALEIELDDKALARLDEIFPGHKTAPEDYAW